MDLTSYRPLGRSGLIVSPLALGTMTFGNPKWGSRDDVSQAIFDAYVDAGGNHVDTADVYGGGRSEELTGTFIAERKLRDKVVLATKFTFNSQPGNPNTGGNGRKNIYRALETSLRRLQTDYIDLYYLHFWDMLTPIDEVLESLVTLQRAGKIRYYALSDIPAWYAARLATLAEARALPGPIAMQLEYSLAERGIEREHLDAAHACGLGLVPWGPLASGFLTGKYTREPEGAVAGEGRFAAQKPSRKFVDRHWNALDGLRSVAQETGKPLPQVALAWLTAQPAVSSILLGASSLAQLQDNLASLQIALTPDQLKRLTGASTPEAPSPFVEAIRTMIFGGANVQPWH